MANPRIAPLPVADRDEATTALLDSLRIGGTDGELNIFATLAHHPRLLKRWAAFGGTLLFRGELSARDRELLILRTAWNCHADYEWGQHKPMAHVAGLNDDEINRTVGPLDDPAWSDADRALLTAAEELHANAVVSDATWAALAPHYSPAQLIEICMVVGQYHLVAFTLNSLGIEREDGVDGFPG